MEVERLVDLDHPVRAIWELVGRLNLEPFYVELESVEGVAGRPVWEPRLLISLWIWNGFYRNGYDGIRIAIEGLKIAKTDDRKALREALEKVRYQGFLGDFRYSPTDHEGTSGEAFVPVIIKDGKYMSYKK